MPFRHFLSVSVILSSLLLIDARSAIIILTSDQQLQQLMDPDAKIDLSLGLTKRFGSLREVCEDARRSGDKTLIVAFDEFFRQYREQAGTERKLMPDMDEYIAKIKKISDFAGQYGMGLELSLLSPLELGPAFTKATGKAGRWLQFTVGVRDPVSGRFCVQLWKQSVWTNNKGNFTIEVKGVRAFAFKEKLIAGQRLAVVPPESIREITGKINLEIYSPEDNKKGQDASRAMRRIEVSQNGENQLAGLDRVLVLVEYQTPEMDYFSPQALNFLKTLLKKYHNAGVRLNSLYSDEMHIQQDWSYNSHHDNGQLSMRYVTRDFGQSFAGLYGSEYIDLDKYMLYFVYGPNNLSNSIYAIQDRQYVMGESVEAIQRTMLFRDRYYKMLQNHVVDLFLAAKQYAEDLYGKEMRTAAHASWAESPTIDFWATDRLHLPAYQYEYTPNFLWSNTVHQAASACYDYFRWGDYLMPTGNDFAECGWLDRNYYGAALAASVGILNRYPNAYAAFWGMPGKSAERKYATSSAFGCQAMPEIAALTENVHRDVEVLMLYPMNLVAAEERFGSWITQYAYANYITAEKLLQMGRIEADKIKIAGRSFSTLVALFEILPQPQLLELMEHFASAGGRVLWFGPPPVLDAGGNSCLSKWQDIFGAKYQPAAYPGDPAAGKIVQFYGAFAHLPQQLILTDLLVDRIYPVQPGAGTEVLATIDGQVAGLGHSLGKGRVYFFGFRPRDDQSASLGYESRTLFEILSNTGAYEKTGHFADINDNTEYVSRTSDYLATRFPNGTTVIMPHYRTHRESWPGGFSRNDSADAKILQANPLPSDRINVQNLKVNGHDISYEGRLICGFRTNADNELVGFAGFDCKQVGVDGRDYRLAEQNMPVIAWVPLVNSQEGPANAILKIFFEAQGPVHVPLPAKAGKVQLLANSGKLVSFEKVAFKRQGNELIIQGGEKTNRRWLYACRRDI